MRTFEYPYPREEGAHARRGLNGTGENREGKGMSNKSRGLTSRPLYVIANYRSNRTNLLTLDLAGNDGAVGAGEDFFLPVFSFEEEAQAFLRFFETDVEREWRRRETRTRELVSILLGPCARVRQVALDPPPSRTLFAEMLPLVSVNRKRFVRALMGERRSSVKELALAQEGGEHARTPQPERSPVQTKTC
jgi:hypothetical protein